MMRVYKSFFSTPDKPPPASPPATLIRQETGAIKTRKMPKPAIFASDEELKLGIAGKLGA